MVLLLAALTSQLAVALTNQVAAALMTWVFVPGGIPPSGESCEEAETVGARFSASRNTCDPYNGSRNRNNDIYDGLPHTGIVLKSQAMGDQ